MTVLVINLLKIINIYHNNSNRQLMSASISDLHICKFNKMVTAIQELQEGKILSRSDSKNFIETVDGHFYFVCGRTCLAGDRFGAYKFDRKIKIGDQLHFIDAGGYSMVKKNWFNGIQMPSIVHKKLDGSIGIVHVPSYEDFKSCLS